MKKSKTKTTEVGDSPITSGRPLMFKPQVLELLGGLAYSTLWEWMKADKFPLPLALGPSNSRSSTIAWYADEVHEWIAKRPRRVIGKQLHEFQGRRSEEEDAEPVAAAKPAKPAPTARPKLKKRPAISREMDGAR